jgi:hypothetical protein
MEKWQRPGPAEQCSILKTYSTSDGNGKLIYQKREI